MRTSRTLLDDLLEAQSEFARIAQSAEMGPVDLISAQAQLETIHSLIATMAPLGSESGESAEAAAKAIAAAEALGAMTMERDAALAQVDALLAERATLIERASFQARVPGSPTAERPPTVSDTQSPMELAPTTFLALVRYDIRRRRSLDDQQGRIYDNEVLVHHDDLLGLSTLLERNGTGDLTIDGMRVLAWESAVRGTPSFAYKAQE